MNIKIDNNRVETHSNVDKVTTSNSDSHVRKTSNQGVFALDISGTVMDNTAYEGHGKTTEDVMQSAGQVDVATQQNYMAVMSNTMSTEDFAKLQEEGYHPGSTEIETVVTIVDQIKAALAKGGKNIVGYTDDLDAETLAQITGSAAYANAIINSFQEHDIPVTKENVEEVMKACERALQLDDLSDGEMKYIIANQMEPTFDNVYKAQHSAATDADKQGKGYYQDDAGYYAKKAEDYNWQQLMPQMEKVIEKAGLEVSQETIADAKWLIEKGMPLTEESINALYELRNLTIPDSIDRFVSLAATAVANGKNAGSANFIDDKTDLEKAVDYLEDVNTISDEAADQVAAEGKVLNIRNLKMAQMQMSITIKSHTYEISVSARRQLEEVRLQMTFQANLSLIRGGFSIDTAELQELVDALKAAEQQNQQTVFASDEATEASERAGWYRNTLARVRELPFMPAALVGRFALQASVSVNIEVSSTEIDYTLDGIYQEGSTLRSAYEKAGETYEALMTAPRADLGDSIKKAFRNVDDILQEMKLDTSEQNRRAVRILGYNQMEISEENITAVKSADLTINRVLDKLTPASALQMIRDGVNPLSMNMEELESYLNQQEKNPNQDMEKYSEFLYKLEKKDGITSEERDSYIGIYRLFRQLEKTDGAAIGTLINQGVEPTVANLLSAMRSNKKHGTNVTVDDTFGGVTASYQGKSISEQIASGYENDYYSKLSSNIFDSLEGSKMSDWIGDEQITLEDFFTKLHKADKNIQTDKDYQRQQLQQMRQAVAEADDTVIKELLEYEQPITTDNLLAAGLLMKERGRLAGKIKEFAAETGKEEQLEAAVHELHDNMTDKKSAGKAYNKLEQTMNDVLEEAVYGEDQVLKINIKEMNNLCKQISLAGNLAKEENYEIPVMIGDEVTSINLKIVHNRNENGKLNASMQSVTYGKVMAQFHMTGQTVSGAENATQYQMSGYIVCDNGDGFALLKQAEEGLKKEFQQSDINIVSLNYIYNEELDLTAAQKAGIKTNDKDVSITNEKTFDQDEVSTKRLYETAKIFIGHIQKGEGL